MRRFRSTSNVKPQRFRASHSQSSSRIGPADPNWVRSFQPRAHRTFVSSGRGFDIRPVIDPHYWTMRAPHGSPLLVRPDGSTETLERIPFEQKRNDPRRYDETWLQEKLYANPEVLPVAEIDRAFAPAFPLARELPTPVGPIDLVLISPSGYLTLVETKLWRNPEARRQVVGQIIDYAKEFTKWRLGDLRTSLRGAMMCSAAENLFAYVQEQGVDTTEQEFLDTLAGNLERGRLLLMLVGDGIRESVQDIADYLQRFAQLQFALGLVDLAVYQRSDGSRLLVPRVVSRTREVTRAVIRIEGVGAASVAHVEVAPDEPEKPGSERFTLSEADFMAQLERESGASARAVVMQVLDFMREVGLEPDYRQSSFTARLANPSGGVPFSLFNVDTNGTIVFGYLRSQLERYGLPLTIQESYASEISRAYGVRLDKWGYPNSISFKKYRDNPDTFKRAVTQAVRALQTVEA